MRRAPGLKGTANDKNYRNLYHQIHFRAQSLPKSVFDPCSALDAAGGAYDAPQTSKSAGEGETFSSHLPVDAFVSESERPRRRAPRFPLGPRRCGVHTAHQMVYPVLVVVIS